MIPFTWKAKVQLTRHGSTGEQELVKRRFPSRRSPTMQGSRGNTLAPKVLTHSILQDSAHRLRRHQGHARDFRRHQPRADPCAKGAHLARPGRLDVLGRLRPHTSRNYIVPRGLHASGSQWTRVFGQPVSLTSTVSLDKM